MTNGLPFSRKSPIISIGLFCLLISGCYQPTSPREVTVAFWTAIAENNPEKAQQLTTEKQLIVLDKKLRNAFVQIGKVSIYYDYAEVETQLTLNSVASSFVFQTFLVRERETDQWLVSYQHTRLSMSPAGFKSVFVKLKESGKNIKTQIKEHGKSWIKGLWDMIVKVFKKLKDKSAD
jgi:hypothetical protein